MASKERIPQLDIFRAIAIFAVMAIHATSRTIAETQGTSLFHPFLLINKFSQFAVPSFIFLSGFVLFYNYIDRPLNRKTLGTFYGRRLAYIIVPYLVFSVLYYILKMTSGHTWDMPLQEQAAKMWKYLWTGTAYTHLYYIIIIIQFYVLFPLILWCLQKVRRLAAWAPLIGLALQWGFVLLNKYMVNHGYWHLTKGSLAITYFSYFLLGAGIASYYASLKKWLVPTRGGWRTGKGATWIALWLLWVIAGVVHVELWFNSYTKHSSINSLWYEGFANLHALLSCLVLWQLSFLLFGAGRSLLARLLVSVGACSFGIYLIHPLVLFLYRKLSIHGGSLVYAAFIAGGWLAAFLVSWFAVVIVQRYFRPAAWVLFGSAPQKPKAISSEQVRS
ncbi:acyltransferase [Paenibacillus sp. NFR01]|uniref:acyltransferase n=1 Tax=Paenibacillus sp. NFR01 TaxID=1566279 RepID=UPI0008AB9A4B|nr:acyltransferase [Paenibacillus sp. NFR01]SEU22478.1 Peptidoglycan/LPS O-acetylase OafA/YrhL, contains acyltransferase and SGNH-hydrolase domains [Paenibacillus sp. NFR01]